MAKNVGLRKILVLVWTQKNLENFPKMLIQKNFGEAWTQKYFDLEKFGKISKNIDLENFRKMLSQKIFTEVFTQIYFALTKIQKILS